MFCVVEFEAGQSSEIGLVREEWLTPKKKEAFWPPFKFAAKYNKCLLNGDQPEDNWSLCPIKKIFYSTDDILKARSKLKAAELESDIHSCPDEHEEFKKRKRQKTRRIYSSSDDSDFGEHQFLVKSTPKKKKRISPVFKENDGDLILPSPPVNNSQSQFVSHLSNVGISNSSSLSTADTVLLDNSALSCSSNSAVSFASCGVPRSNCEFVLQKISKHLSKIENELSKINEVHAEILCCVKRKENEDNVYSQCIGDVNLPCRIEDDILQLEKWLKESTENQRQFGLLFCNIGGRKIEMITRRILEKIFTNEIAVLCNWTGKNGKFPLKELILIDIIKGAIRQNHTKITTNIITDADIELIIKNWFRFSKDRNGGREFRRSKQSVAHN